MIQLKMEKALVGMYSSIIVMAHQIPVRFLQPQQCMVYHEQHYVGNIPAVWPLYYSTCAQFLPQNQTSTNYYQYHHQIQPPRPMLKGQYEIVRILGEGAFGKVMECIDHSKNLRVAVKMIKSSTSENMASMYEVQMLRTINSLNSEKKMACVQMLDWFNHYNHVCIVFELLGISTFDLLSRNNFKPFTVEQIRPIADQICKAVHFLHQNKIAHTDLKPDNILFVSHDRICDNVEQCLRLHRGVHVKLADFGNAMYIHHSQKGIVSTQPYRAPEVILDFEWNEACDVWSLGCILLEYYLGRPLFWALDSITHLAIMERVLGPVPDYMLQNTRKQCYVKEGKLAWDEHSIKGQNLKRGYMPLMFYKKSLSLEHEQLFDLLRKMLGYDVSQRITMDVAIRHMFFTQQ